MLERFNLDLLCDIYIHIHILKNESVYILDRTEIDRNVLLELLKSTIESYMNEDYFLPYVYKMMAFSYMRNDMILFEWIFSKTHFNPIPYSIRNNDVEDVMDKYMEQFG